MSIASIIFLAAQLSSSGQHLPQAAILPTRTMVRRQEQTSGQGGGEPPEPPELIEPLPREVKHIQYIPPPEIFPMSFFP